MTRAGDKGGGGVGSAIGDHMTYIASFSTFRIFGEKVKFGGGGKSVVLADMERIVIRVMDKDTMALREHEKPSP